MINDKQREERKNGIFSSDVPRIMMGETVEVALEKMGEKEPVNLDNEPSVQLGTLLEGKILDAYEAQGHSIIERSPDTLRHPEHTWLGCHLDARSQACVIDGKTWSAYQRDQWGEPGSDEVPDKILWQVQQQMAVTGAPVAHVPVCFIDMRALIQLLTAGDLPIDIFIVPRSPDLIDYLINQSQQVWNCVREKRLPEPVKVGDARLIYKKDDGSQVEASHEIVEMLKQRVLIKNNIKEWERSVHELDEAIQRYMREATELRRLGFTVCTWKKDADSQVIDAKALKKAHPEIYQQFLTTREGKRKFIPKEKEL